MSRAMKQQPTRAQVLDALRTHKKLYVVAKVFGVSAPTFKKWMTQFGICANHNVKAEPNRPW